MNTIQSVTAYLIVRDAAAAIDFYQAAFGAELVTRMDDGSGRIGHAELRIGDGTIFLADEFPEYENIVGPETLGGTAVVLDMMVTDVVAVFERAVAAGALRIRQPDDPKSGVQSSKVVDPFGHVWLITHVIE